MRGHLTEKADVFGFGVVALEIVSGRPNSDSFSEDEKIHLLEWVCFHLESAQMNLYTQSTPNKPKVKIHIINQREIFIKGNHFWSFFSLK